MHIYYEDHKVKFRKEMDGFLHLIATELKESTGIPYEDFFNEVWDTYERDFLSRFPYIGGSKNSGTKNLTGAYYFVAMGEVARNHYGMSLETWGYLTTLCYKRSLEKIPVFARRVVGRLFHHPRFITKLLQKKDIQNARNAAAHPGSFKTKTQPGTPEYPLCYHNIVCPLANFARDYGYMDYMPYICNLDYVMFELFNVPFYREHTCAAGDDYCDFKLKANAPVNSSWPCHCLTPGDPLK